MVKIRALAHALPRMAVTNRDLIDSVVRHNPQFTDDDRNNTVHRLGDFLESSGARRRFHRTGDERAADFAIAAGTMALERAGLAPTAIDLLIFVGVGRGFVEPATANVFQAALGLVNATCFDVLDACASWLRGLDVANLYLQSGRAQHAMIINCECNYREYIQLELDSPGALDLAWAGFTIGEAATATIVSADGGDNGFRARLSSAGEFNDLCNIPLPHASEFVARSNGHGRTPLKFYSDSKRLNFHAVQRLAAMFDGDPRVKSTPYDIIFGHSVSVPASRAVADRLGLDIDKHYEIFPDYGNTVSASIPLAMSLASAEGRLKPGDRVLLLVASAGLTTGYATLTF